MSNYEANPVGFLYERYQSSGISPIYEVRLIRGQAHAPIFEAVLRVPEGDSVTATGSSKKIAKNIAAKLMLDKLDEKKTDQDQSGAATAPGDDNNNPSQRCQTDGETKKVKALTASSAASVGNFYRSLQGSQGEVLGQLLSGEICLKADSCNVDYTQVLENLSQEQNFSVNDLQLEGFEDLEQSVVQILNGGSEPAVTVCLGMGAESRQTAARCALLYIKTMANTEDPQ